MQQQRQQQAQQLVQRAQHLCDQMHRSPQPAQRDHLSHMIERECLRPILILGTEPQREHVEWIRIEMEAAQHQGRAGAKPRPGAPVPPPTLPLHGRTQRRAKQRRWPWAVLAVVLVIVGSWLFLVLNSLEIVITFGMLLAQGM